MQLATVFDYNVKFYFQFQLNEIILKLSMKNETVQHGILLSSMKDWISVARLSTVLIANFEHNPPPKKKKNIQKEPPEGFYKNCCS